MSANPESADAPGLPLTIHWRQPTIRGVAGDNSTASAVFLRLVDRVFDLFQDKGPEVAIVPLPARMWWNAGATHGTISGLQLHGEWNVQFRQDLQHRQILAAYLRRRRFVWSPRDIRFPYFRFVERTGALMLIPDPRQLDVVTVLFFLPGHHPAGRALHAAVEFVDSAGRSHRVDVSFKPLGGQQPLYVNQY